MKDIRFASGCFAIAAFFAILALGPREAGGAHTFLATYIQGEGGPTLFTYICGFVVALMVIGGVNNLYDLREEDSRKANAKRDYAEALNALSGGLAHHRLRLPGRWFWYLLVAALAAVVLGLILR